MNKTLKHNMKKFIFNIVVGSQKAPVLKTELFYNYFSNILLAFLIHILHSDCHVWLRKQHNVFP